MGVRIMGYRHSMYLVNKEVCEEVKNMTYKELVSKYGEGDYFRPDNLEIKEIYDFGKLYWDDTAERIYEKGSPVFRKDVMEILEDYVPYLVNKAGLEMAIEIYRKKTEDLYNKLRVDCNEMIAYMGVEIPFDNSVHENIEQFIQEKIRGWSAGNIYNLNLNNDEIINSYNYEYQIFELVRLYKSIDFNKYNILFMGG